METTDEEAPLCEECRQPKRRVPCSECDGAGELLEEDTGIDDGLCPECGGRGYQWECEQVGPHDPPSWDDEYWGPLERWDDEDW